MFKTTHTLTLLVHTFIMAIEAVARVEALAKKRQLLRQPHWIATQNWMRKRLEDDRGRSLVASEDRGSGKSQGSHKQQQLRHLQWLLPESIVLRRSSFLTPTSKAGREEWYYGLMRMIWSLLWAAPVVIVMQFASTLNSLAFLSFSLVSKIRLDIILYCNSLILFIECQLHK